MMIEFWIILAIVAFASEYIPRQKPIRSPSDVHKAIEQQLRRNLTWGKLNFIHSTDTHGWLTGHLLEPNFNADWGDYISFVQHMREKADLLGVDLVVIDSGDRHDGNGLSDATTPNGAYSQTAFCKLDLDLVTLGNHELYHPEIAEQEYDVLVSHYKDKYLSSNVEIKLDDDWRPLGNRYKHLVTTNTKTRLTAFGFLYEFERACSNTRVLPVEQVVAQEWFQEALRAPADAILLVTHIPARQSREISVLVDAIRRVHPTLPIIGFGGHTHVRDFVELDESAVVLQSGRFLETIGWLSYDPDRTDKRFSRTYIDFNKNGLKHHAEVPQLSTSLGQAVSKEISEQREILNLTKQFGCTPQNYYTDRVPFESNSSVYTLLAREILPQLKPADDNLATVPRCIVANTGSIRFDLFQGPFTLDSAFILSPFQNRWIHISEVPLWVVDKLLAILNREKYLELGLPSEDTSQIVHTEDEPFDLEVHMRGNTDWIELTRTALSSTPFSHVSLGYVTQDDLGVMGDDTIHYPWRFHHVPNVVSSKLNMDHTPETVDLVFFDFMHRFVSSALEEVGQPHLAKQTRPYGGASVKDLFISYASSHWHC